MSALIHYQHAHPQEAIADKELADLIEALSRHGILRFLTALTGALPHVGLITARGLNTQTSRTTLQNMVTLLSALGHVPPQDFSRFVGAVSAATQSVERETWHPQTGNGEPPGITGAYRLLQDDALWHALGPLLDGLKAFGEVLGAARATEQPPPPNEPLL
ncbi:helical membrane plugin domain-containing protein [Acidiferrobacter thiooxydans]|uniref:Uncharacterized protein n=1 Tax=Acidiferrobacter thiooxydans TaxID=163359 RepID=A0A1C2G540_9GAMM|nr:DUF1641 domain-containing protein [Acidiferrobacter thiooxydans]RCN56571.1 hypothetical protein C4900_12325 [Acidiferrobacter thiooxydans]UEN99223.1 DUF1641 domain-containing protein [Acidiferrobacter thiooxydans]